MKMATRFAASSVIFAALAVLAGAQSSVAPEAFPPFERWKAAVLAGDASALKDLYSTDPAAQIRLQKVMNPAVADTDFWLNLKPRSMNVEIVRLIVRPARANVIFHADATPSAAGAKPLSVTDDQTWMKQGDQWRLVYAERNDSPALANPANMKKDLYPADANARAEIKEAEEKAAKEHKRLLLVFGANWCFDCHVLDLAFQRPDLAPLVANYEVVHVDIGPDGKKNADVAEQFDVPLDKGVPAMAVVDADGKVVVSDKSGEVEDARGLAPEYLAEFLNKWKP